MHAELIDDGSTISVIGTCRYGYFPTGKCIASGHVPESEVCISYGDLY